MSLTLDALTVLDAIDRKGSFAAAAEELHRVPSAISYTVQKLEQDLDVAIFDRAGHRAVLTPAGQALLKEGRRLLYSADELEAHVKRVATGWEAELRIAVDTIIPASNVLPLVQAFYRENCGTQLFISREVLGGTWDALVTGRADLIFGASGEGPTGGGYSSVVLGEPDMVFVVTPDHPLAKAEEPIPSAELLKYRVIAIADTSRYLAPRTAGLLTGQEVLKVPDMETKVEAQLQGLGIGSLPRAWIRHHLDAERLLIKQVEGTQSRPMLHAAWRSEHRGKALKWFTDKLKDDSVIAELMQVNV